jgi:hypothetical protein
MAEIILSGEELIGILQANGWVPDEVAALDVDGREIRMKVRTPFPLLKSFPLTVQFVCFEEGHVVLEFETNRLMDHLGSMIGRLFEASPLVACGGRWEYPRLYVRVNQLIEQRVRGVKVEDVVFRNDRFHIRTTHTAPAGPGPVEPKGRSSPACNLE